MREISLSCVLGVADYGDLLIEAFCGESSCVSYSASNVSTEDSSWEIRVGWLICMDVDYADLGIGCL